MRVISICSICNKVFYHDSSKKGITCSKHCRQKMLDRNATIKKCLTCDKLMRIPRWQLKAGKKYCSKKCYDIGQTGEKSPSWKGGHNLSSLQWAKRNPEYMAYMSAKRRQRLRGTEGGHTLEQWKELIKKHDYKCVYCGSEKKLSKDHIVPLSKGGDDYISNIQPLCITCNKKKGNRLDYPTIHSLGVKVQFLGD